MRLVADFADQSPAAQLDELSRLRRIGSTAISDLIAIGALSVAIIFGISAMAISADPGSSVGIIELTEEGKYWYWNIFLVGGIAMALWCLWFFGRAARHAADARALVAAYEAELSRRENARGRRARAWRSAHPIYWSSDDAPS